MVRADACAVLLASLFCCGTWPALLQLAGRTGRHPAISYCDYTLGYVLVAVLTALAFPGALVGGGSVALALVAMLGGSLLCVGNLCLQIAVDLGCPLTVTLPLQASLTVILGTSLNYALQPRRSDAVWLFLGVALFAAAIALSAKAQVDYDDRERAGDAARATHQASPLVSAADATATPERPSSDEADAAAPKPRARRGLVVAFGGGAAFGAFSPCFNVAVNDEFGWSSSGPLRLWTANVLFAAGFALGSLATNARRLPRPAVRSYRAEPLRSRALPFLAGVVCAAGNELQFYGGTLAGFAASDLVQAFPVVGMVWGRCLFADFEGAPPRVVRTLVAVYASYLAAVLFLFLSVR